MRPALVMEKALASRFLRRFCWFLPSLDRFRRLCRSPHQLGQPDEVVGSGSQGEHPADAGEAAVTGLAKASGRLGPAKHLLNALAQLPTDRMAGMAVRSPVDGRAPVRCVLSDMRRHMVRTQIGDKLGHIIGLVGAKRDPMMAGSTHGAARFGKQEETASSIM
jgi:hypothetical protein